MKKISRKTTELHFINTILSPKFNYVNWLKLKHCFNATLALDGLSEALSIENSNSSQ